MLYAPRTCPPHNAISTPHNQGGSMLRSLAQPCSHKLYRHQPHLPVTAGNQSLTSTYHRLPPSRLHAHHNWQSSYTNTTYCCRPHACKPYGRYSNQGIQDLYHDRPTAADQAAQPICITSNIPAGPQPYAYGHPTPPLSPARCQPIQTPTCTSRQPAEPAGTQHP